MEIREKYLTWLENCKSEKELYRELLSVQDNAQEISDRFYRDLAFGTGGLRGTLGVGTNRMNVFTVGRATFGFAEYLLKQKKHPSVAIAFDSRIMSKEFAYLAADILSYKGIKVYIFGELMPTPVLSFAVRYFKTSGGIVITASHNPKEYNGYKVYNENGCQITDAVAADIYSEIQKAKYFNDFAANKKLINILGDEILDKFIEEIGKYSLNKINSDCGLKIVYTPLNGTGRKPVLKVLNRMGFNNVVVVAEQEYPDGNFTTCPFPNPEYHETFKYALKYAKNIGADIILATDPDADRVGVAIKTYSGEYKFLTGNETGVLLCEYMLSQKQKRCELNPDSFVVKTIVTTDMVFSIARKYGVKIKEVLTGFKYIGEEIDKSGGYVFGLEESCGYLIGTHARDKDAVSAVMMIAEMTAYYKSQGISLCEKLDALYREYGYYSTSLLSKDFKGQAGAIVMRDILDRIRSTPLREIVAEKVEEYTDFINGYKGLPKSNVQRFKSKNIRLIIRNSGTEPKLKAYIETTGKTQEEAIETNKKIYDFCDKKLLNN